MDDRASLARPPRTVRHRPALRVAAALALLAVPAAASVLAWAAAGLAGDVRAPGPAHVDVLLALVAAVGAAVVLAVLTVTTAIVLLGALGQDDPRRTPSRRPAVRAAWTPRLLRRLGEVALGVALVGGGAGAAVATTGPHAPPPAPTRVTAPPTPGPAVDRPAVTGHPPAAAPASPPRSTTGWRPDRPAPPRRAPASVHLVTAAARLEHARRHTVVVRRGDSLWRLVERYLGPTASAAEVAAEWPRWYAANRSLIGPDPDLLRPGQQLVPPLPR